MHDLRKQVLLESKKTVSRKARSKETTPPTSRNGSRTASAFTSPRGSRGPSRQGSDDEGDFSDGDTEYSVQSLDAFSEQGPEDDDDTWAAALEECIEAIVDRKRSSTEGREEKMTQFSRLLTRHYARDQISRKMDELLPALLKSVKSGQSEREIILALRAIALILITDPSETVYDAVQDPIKKIIQDSEHPPAKVAAIHALAIATFYGGASEDEQQDIMDFFLDIASTDGAVIDEQDNGNIVVAALEEWGFLATQLEDMEDATEPAMDTFVDQLESVDVGVQLAAGDNIALLYEKSYTEAESDDEHGESEEEDADGNRMVQRYTVYRQTHQLQQSLERLANVSSKRFSKKDRKQLHQTFNDILNTIEKPTRGPRYSTALDDEGRELGSRLKVSIPHGGKRGSSKMTIDKWWKLQRLNALKRLLQAGFLVHYEANETVFDSLPVMVEED